MNFIDDVKKIAQEFLHVDEQEANEIIDNLTKEQKRRLARMYKLYGQVREEITKDLRLAKEQIKSIETQVREWLQSQEKK